MKKSSMILKLICLTVAALLCLSALPAFAEEAVEMPEDVVAEDVTEDVAEEEAVEDESASEEVEEEEEVEILDLFSATLRDGGIYVTPSEDNAAVFTYENLRYRVLAGTGNLIKLDGFESNPTIKDEIADGAKNSLQANGEITTEAAHSGYFGLSVKAGDVVYRTAVNGGDIYVFSAWVKMPSDGSIYDDDRAFKVVGESGESYVVGWNEIGRDIPDTGSWQQIIFTFKAPETGLFQIDFAYKGKTAMALDDIELYDAEIFDNPLDITAVVCTDAEGNEYDRSTGFTTAGTLTHTTTLYNSDEDDVFFTAVMALFKNDILVDFEYSEECALVLDEAEVTFEIEIPEDDDITQYKYMVYFISDTAPTQYYGEMPSLLNPYIVQGK